MKNEQKVRQCKACGDPVEGYGYWCSDACWRAEDGGDNDEREAGE